MTDFQGIISKAAYWIQIYASDEVLFALRTWMQAAFGDAPPGVSMRFLGELLLAIRRDVGDPTTSATVVDLLALKINDIYSVGLAATLALPEDQFLASHDWVPPWAGSA
ncbi:MAG TPA: hypothetical protein VIK61_16060 [Acidimicrobiia bacterium]